VPTPRQLVSRPLQAAPGGQLRRGDSPAPPDGVGCAEAQNLEVRRRHQSSAEGKRLCLRATGRRVNPVAEKEEDR